MSFSIYKRTKNYGRVDSLNQVNPNNETIYSLPIYMKSEERWICHIIYPSYFSIYQLGDFGCYITLVDNFGEIYYWTGGRQYSNITVCPAADKEADIYKREDMDKFIIQPKEERLFAFTDNFIDILKSSYIPYDSRRYEANRSNKPSIGIQEYINTLLKTNKNIVDEFEGLEKKLKEYTEDMEEQIDYKPLESSSTREVLLLASEKRIEKEKMRGILNTQRFNVKLNSY